MFVLGLALFTGEVVMFPSEHSGNYYHEGSWTSINICKFLLVSKNSQKLLLSSKNKVIDVNKICNNIIQEKYNIPQAECQWCEKEPQVNICVSVCVLRVKHTLN